MKRIIAIAGTLLLSAALFAQAAGDGFLVPLEKDLTDAIKANASPAAVAVSGGSKVLQGIWIETTSQSDFLIRDVATGKKKGFELDANHFLSNANWWFWGDINSVFHLDAEIAVWDFDKVIFQSNSYAGNVPDVTLGDGLQKLAAFFFSPIANGNDSGIGSFNKLGLGIQTPYADVLVGYGNLKANGMSEFEGIYNVIDRWNDVGKGFTEIRTGKKLSKIGDFNIRGVAALSQMLGTYGMYDILSVTYKDNYQAALTFGSKTTAEQLFFYNTAATNALSAYLRARPFEFLQLEAHGIGTFGSEIDFNSQALALAGRLSYFGKNDKLTVSLKESYAGENVDSVWGSDTQDYNNICADTLTTALNLDWNAVSFLKLGLDSAFVMNDTDDLSNGLATLRAQPIFDFDFNSILQKDLTVSAYGVANIDRLSASTSKNREFVPYFNEAGLEVCLGDIGVKKLVFDWGASLSYKDWESGNSYNYESLYNSFMISCDVNDTLNVHLGAIVRTYSDDDETNVPFGLATGVKINSVPLPGNPFFWIHFCYGMNPYEDNNYSLYRADDPLNKASHRTYLLNSLDESTTSSQISLGLIWSL